MFDFIYRGGPIFMVPLLVIFIIMLVLMVKGFIQGNSDKNRAYVASLSLLGLVSGILGTTIGMIEAMDKIAQANDIAPQVLADGFRIGLLPTAFGLSIFVIGRIGILALLMKKK